MLVDAHLAWRRRVKQVIDAAPDMTVVGEAGNGAEAAAGVLSVRPDLILMDVNDPSLGGVEATLTFCNQQPGTRILMLIRSESDDQLFECIRAGAVGFLSKDVSPDRMIEAIRDTMAGESILPASVTARMVRYIQSCGKKEPEKAVTKLTPRECQVLRLIARGARDREVAQQLFISVSTVKKHVQNVLRKLQARNRAEAVSYLHSRELDPSGG